MPGLVGVGDLFPAGTLLAQKLMQQSECGQLSLPFLAIGAQRGRPFLSFAGLISR
jgi:hypothetical protein